MTDDNPPSVVYVDPPLRPDVTSYPDAALGSDPSLWGMVATQFLGAFNDNVFKQLVMLLAVGGPLVGSNVVAPDRQWLAQLVFAVPFIAFSGVAGLLSERFSKRRVVVACKVAEIAIVLLGLAAFWHWKLTGLVGVLAVLFLMGTHSAFFGPSKYGILPELFPVKYLPRINGLILMTTFLAIIFGTALAGGLKQLFGNDRIWMASFVCLAVALLGTQTALFVRWVPPADPQARFHWSTLAIPKEMVRLLRQDRQLLLALLVSCMFWLIGGIVHPSVNAVGNLQFEVGDLKTSILAAAMGIGIAVGCLAGGFYSRDRIDFRLMRFGAWSLIGTLLLLAVPGFGKMNLLGYWGSFVVLTLLGAAAGLFVIPLQAFLQARPPASLKGRTIGTMNFANWIAIVLSAGLYFVFNALIVRWEWPRTTLFAFAALLMLPVALFYRPQAAGQN